jgi:hypothetical protein
MADYKADFLQLLIDNISILESYIQSDDPIVALPAMRLAHSIATASDQLDAENDANFIELLRGLDGKN